MKRWDQPITRLASHASVELSQLQLTKLVTFVGLVADWRTRTDLVAARNEDRLVEVLLLDAFMLAPQVVNATSVVDIGAGAGAPAIPLAIMVPATRFILVEPRRKRVAFMRTAVGTLGIGKRVKIIEGRHGDVDECFDFAYSRATFNPSQWLSIGAVLADRVAVLLAGGDVPKLPGWSQISNVKYATHDGAPRRLLVLERQATLPR